MKFVKLYQENQASVKGALKSMWCSDPHSPQQKAYAERIGKMIDSELFSSEKFMPLVQCMDRYEPIDNADFALADSLVGGLWSKLGKSYLPYKHQMKCWQHLHDGDSIAVTTGTGSGKTECFMLPLVSDLIARGQGGQIQAIFLYPLNALMEDQKDRLQELLSGTNLKFAVYNGNLPEDDGASARTQKRRDQLKRQVDAERKKYPNIIATRKELRNIPPNIVLTNPTMLEYMLLRNKDQQLFTKESLKWIVIDEAHTFTGAGAAELAMLIRRVLDAFGVTNTDEIRFATSSATIGNATSQQEKDRAIVKFISDITGSRRVKPVDGKRMFTVSPNDPVELTNCRNILGLEDYVRLDRLFPDPGETIIQKLERLDALCELPNPLKAKVHFFYRVPSNGLRVRLNETEPDHTFKLYSMTPAVVTGAPYLELMRCEHCGEYFAVAETVHGSSDKYKSPASTDNDIFDFNSASGSGDKLIVSLTDRAVDPNDNSGNTPITVRDDTFTEDMSNPAGWHLQMNVQKCCPCCGSSLSGHEENAEEDEEIKNVRRFRVSAPFVSRNLAPGILDNLTPEQSPAVTGLPHKGQQFISFVDSRQNAAKATMQQNLEEERLWLYSRLYDALGKRASTVNPIVIQTRSRLKATGAFSDEEIDRMAPMPKLHMTWAEIFDMLYSQPEAERLAFQFINKRELSDEYDTDNQKVDVTAKSKYIYSAMIEQLGKRPKSAAAPETMGLFVSYYEKLERIKELPENVIKFNNAHPDKNITLEDWKNLLKMFLDTYVRSNESLYLKNGNGSDNLDIRKCCSRFGTTKPPRRPVHKPHIGEDKQGRYLSSIVLLATLLDPGSQDINDTIFNNRQELNEVLDDMWKDLTETTGLLQHSERLFDARWDFDTDKDAARERQYRLNAADISFKLYDKVWLCDARKVNDTFPVPRPVDTLFKGYGPYIINNKAAKALTEEESWEVYPYFEGKKDGAQVCYEDIASWAANHRKILWDNGIWGDNGCFADRLNEIHAYPEIFVQAEHTAQVDKLIAKQSQELFKGREINILACSTTMEMGVDLGSLEMVVMSSVPPHPSNYKQRAGRSGRNDNPKSACITLCNSDSVGLRTILNPMEALINRPMQTPFVDLNSPQVIQRHANAYLFRLSGIFFNNAGGNANNLDQEVIELFTPYHFATDARSHTKRYDDVRDVNNNSVYPCDLLGDKTATKYYAFKNFLDSCATDPKNHIDRIIAGTAFDSSPAMVIQNCKDDIDRCHEELLVKVSEIAEAYDDAKDAALADPAKAGAVHGNSLENGYGFYLRHKYTELLSKSVIEYFATNRFTPNANMPVNIVEFDINLDCGDKNDKFKSSNPSYPLQQAISQYSPGNTIVLENRTYKVRGLLYTGMFKHNVTFKNIYSDGVSTVIGEGARGMLQNQLKEWPVNRKTELTMVEPYAFIPDINEEHSRTVDDAPYTQVSAQLIGAGDWADLSNTSSLVSVRNNRDCGDANILYYNEGIGFGYCFCANCGKAVLESAPGTGLIRMPADMHNEVKEVAGEEQHFHFMINRKDKNNRRISCFSNKDKIKRNVIIGGLIQTDYSELRFRRDDQSPWIFDRNDDNMKLVITLGVVFTQTFVERLGKDRQDIDFAVTPDCHLCIFDTNPGGSGYSNQLVNRVTLQEVAKASLTLLNSVTSKDELIDRYTKRYYDYIDIDMARTWLQDEINTATLIPAHVKNIFGGNSKIAVFEDILEDFKSIGGSRTLFVEPDWNSWDYHDEARPTLSWKSRINEIRTRGTQKKVCVHKPTGFIKRPIISVLNSISDWAKVEQADCNLPAGIFPLALVNGHFYFTDQKETASMNSLWGRGNIFCVDAAEALVPTYGVIDLNPLPTTIKFKIDGGDPFKIKCSGLAPLVVSKSGSLVDEFLDHCAKCPDDLEVISCDEHMKSPMGIVMSLAFARYFIQKIGKPFSIDYMVERYSGDHCRDIAFNLDDSDMRDKFLQDSIDKWCDDIKSKLHLCGSGTVSCGRPRSLPHWRELCLRCGNKELVIYPNGGLANGWFYDKQAETVILTPDTVSYENDIPLYRKQDIMYDVEIIDIA